MNKNLDSIANLASRIGAGALNNGKVNLEKIAKSERILIIEGNYENHFIGQLVHYSKKFYIVLNTNITNTCESSRIRFTVAHELGHYFIESHRKKLSNGISLSFLNGFEDKNIDTEANHFAANLLMPQKHFRKHAKKFEPGFSTILNLKVKYDTSIESTALHYINQNLSPSFMIRWNSDFKYSYSRYSFSFSQLTNIIGYPPLKFESDYVKKQTQVLESGNIDYIESATTLSRWFYTISPGSRKDILGLEQTVKLGEYGGITLLTFC